ncbi:hypothetical protein [Rhizobium herbae]|uniref:hypothetical protein n=1 Tax=Rhizobium herbae TaxID=508661 RepID=UPI001CB7A9D7|nr:hypothetical protein [Rhizobium herbae]
MFKTEALSAMQSGRLNAALDRQYRFDGVVKSLRSHIEELAAAVPLELTEGDGMIDYPRTHFNRLAVRPKTPISRVSGRNDTSTSTDGRFRSWSMTRPDVDLGLLLGSNIGILHRHRRTMLAGFLFGADLIASSFQVDFSSDRMFFP